jgi:branched-chain amino acid transport system permease protein
MRPDVVIETATRASRTGAIVAVGVIAAVASMPWWVGSGTMRTGVELLYYLALAQVWNLMAGYGGLISFGQQAFIGIGGYALVLFAYRLGLDPYLTLAIGAALAGLFAWPMSKLLFRLHGAYFAVGTWIAAECWRLVFANWSWLGGGSGISITATVRGIEPWWREALAFWLAALIGLGSIAGVYVLLRSRFGLALMALRDSEVASESIGISVTQLKTWVYVVAAAAFGLVGGLIFLTKLRISPDSAVSINWSVTIVFIVVVGGIGTIEGPIIGVVLYFLLREYLADYGAIYMIVFGLLAITVMLTLKGGIWGTVQRRFDLHFFPVQRRLRSSQQTLNST